jgi:hypothetical protein
VNKYLKQCIDEKAVCIDKLSKKLVSLSIINRVMVVSFNIKLNIKTGNRRSLICEHVRGNYKINFFAKYTARAGFIVYLTAALLFGSVSPFAAMMPININEDVRALEKSLVYSTEVQKKEKKVKTKKQDKTVILQEKYKKLAGYYYYPNVEPYLPEIDNILTSKGLDNNALFIQAMFFIGQHESHWNTGSVSASSVGSEHPTGIFQFLPSTFRTVSRGNIYDETDQIYAFVTMVERGRVDEFATLFIPGLSPAAKSYVLSYN